MWFFPCGNNRPRRLLRSFVNQLQLVSKVKS
uniref:Uncharacterized protein n=1 Tax=Rhizophora mucronata TaxID=61149 RepID=A0A2P2J134_RHIMU